MPLRQTPVEMTSVVLGHLYTIPVTHQYLYISAPQVPLSPPIDEPSKCYLPSISSLFSLADALTTLEQVQPSQTIATSLQYVPTTVNQSMQLDSRFDR